jgi:hypothetical protein
MPKVVVTGAPGFPEPFRATIVPGLHEVLMAGAEEPVTVLSTEAGELIVVDSKYIEEVDS